MFAEFIIVCVPTGLFFALLLCLELGRRIGLRQRKNLEENRAGLGVVEGAIFALMGLLIAFTFSGAASRFDSRRDLIAREANAIGTAWLRLDLLPAEAQPSLREKFRLYLDARLAMFRHALDIESSNRERDRATALQGEIWNLAVAAGRNSNPPAGVLLLPALNDMFDVTTLRAVAVKNHPPPVVYVTLVILALGSALLAGCEMAGSRGRSWLHILTFSVVLALTVYVTLDLEFPRLGLIQISHMDQVLVDLRQSMK
jgi:hypothetical protein